jgi:F420-non-reducing hydrogenase large subunit
MKTITIAPVTRIEGHAKITINLDDSGNVADTFVNVVELRGFEKFCIGRPVEEMPRIVTSICGGPDFVMGPDSDYSVRNVIGIAQANPEIAKKVIRNRHLGAQMLNIISGKSIHPVTAVPGGFSKPLTEAEREKLVPMANEVLEFAKFAIAFAKENIFPKYLDAIKTIGVIETGFLGTVTDDGTLELYDGKARLMKPDGSYEEFQYDQYTEYIGEHIEPWTYLKFPYAKNWGDFSMDLDNSSGIYRTNTLARINVCDKMATPLAQAELEEFRENFGRPAQQTLLYNYARLIELVYNAEHAVELLNDPEITGKEIRVPVTPRAARGVGCVEAPRGTLIHDYETDENGLITNVNLIVGTTHNNAPINMSVKQAAKAYDPCLSCATHKLDGSIAVKLEIRNARGEIIDTMTN